MAIGPCISYGICQDSWTRRSTTDILGAVAQIYGRCLSRAVMIDAFQLWDFICLFLIHPEPLFDTSARPSVGWSDLRDRDTQGDQLIKKEGYCGSVWGFSLCGLVLMLQTSSKTSVLIGLGREE